MLFDTVISPYWCDLNLNIEETVQALLEFYNCNKKVKSKKKPSDKIGFLFDYDMDLIYAAFRQQYKINLFTCNMHWWEFKAMLDGLTDTTKFVQVVGYRVTDLSKNKDKN